MFWFICLIVCNKYNIKFCKLDKIYIEGPASAPLGTNVVEFTKAIVTFSEVSQAKNLRVINIEQLPGYVFDIEKITQEAVFLPYAKNVDEQLFEIVPSDYISCFRIAQNSKCLTSNAATKEFKLEECRADDADQLYEFICTDCADYHSEYTRPSVDEIARRESTEIQALSEKMGRLDVSAYNKIQELESIMKNMSRCFTTNGICNEHSVEQKPLPCFSTFDMAHHLTDNGEERDREHHQDTISATDDISKLHNKSPKIIVTEKKEDEDRNKAIDSIIKEQNLFEKLNSGMDKVLSKIKDVNELVPSKDDFKKELLDNILTQAPNVKDRIVDKFKNEIGSTLVSSIDPKSWLEKLTDTITKTKEAAKEHVNNIIDDFKDKAEDKKQWVQSLLDKVGEVKKSVADNIINGLKNDDNGNKLLDNAIDKAITLKDNAVSGLKDFFSKNLNSLNDYGQHTITNLLNKANEQKDKAKDEIKKAIANHIVDPLRNAGQGISDKINEGVSELKDTLGSLKSTAQSKLNDAKLSGQQLIDALTNMGIKSSKIDKSVSEDNKKVVDEAQFNKLKDCEEQLKINAMKGIK